MKRARIMLFALLALLSLNVFGQAPNATFDRIYRLIEHKNFFKAKEIYDLKKNDLSATYQKLVEVSLDNAFNRLAESNDKIKQLLKAKSDLPDSLVLKLYGTKEDNSIKLFDYKEAKDALNAILTNYRGLLTEIQLDELKNNLKIWTALENEPKQQVVIKETNRIKMEKDKVGLNNLSVSNEKDTVNVIFDTGANLSTVTATTAKKFGMKIIPVDIEVGTITGEKVRAQIAVCPMLKLGSIEIRNAVFLVLEDKGLSFPQIGYQIHAILGFPVIEALREVQITQDGYFIVPKEETQTSYQPNMAMNGLTPLIYIDGRHFTFDTGADKTILFSSYYAENSKEIDETYKLTKVSVGGAGGKKEFDGYVVTRDFNILDKKVTLKDIYLLKEKRSNDEIVYGNIGQNLIKQFNKMTMNFDQMFIKFD